MITIICMNVPKAERDVCQTDMGMKDPVPQLTHVITNIRDRYPDVSYINIVEPRVDANVTRESTYIPT